MNLRLSQNQDNFGGAGLRARRNHGRPGTAAPPNRRIGRAVHADAGGHGPPYEKSRSGLRPPLGLGLWTFHDSPPHPNPLHPQTGGEGEKEELFRTGKPFF
jgi:hypothetical protein